MPDNPRAQHFPKPQPCSHLEMGVKKQWKQPEQVVLGESDPNRLSAIYPFTTGHWFRRQEGVPAKHAPTTGNRESPGVLSL